LQADCKHNGLPGWHLWACAIRGCTFAGCSRYASSHAVQHFETSHHTVSMSTDGKVWCYACDRYLGVVIEYVLLESQMCEAMALGLISF